MYIVSNIYQLQHVSLYLHYNGTPWLCNGSSLGKMKPADFPARDPGQIKETLKDLRILGEYASCFERLFLGKELTLEAHLDNLSTCHTCSSPSSVKTIFLHLHANNMASQFVPAQQHAANDSCYLLERCDCTSERHLKLFPVLGLYISTWAKFWNHPWPAWTGQPGKSANYKFSRCVRGHF